MKESNFNLIKLEAEDGKVFDWKDLTQHVHGEEDENGNVKMVQDHLYVKTLFLGITDSADNYIEVDAPQQEDNENEN